MQNVLFLKGTTLDASVFRHDRPEFLTKPICCLSRKAFSVLCLSFNPKILPSSDKNDTAAATTVISLPVATCAVPSFLSTSSFSVCVFLRAARESGFLLL